MKQLVLFKWPHISSDYDSYDKLYYASVFVEDYFGEGRPYGQVFLDKAKEKVDSYIRDIMREFYV